MIYAIVSAVLFGVSVPLCKWLGVEWLEILLAEVLYLSSGIGLMTARIFLKTGKPSEIETSFLMHHG